MMRLKQFERIYKRSAGYGSMGRIVECRIQNAECRMETIEKFIKDKIKM